MAISPQAQGLITALRAIGIPRNAFMVRTDRHRCSMFNADTGVTDRWREYGNANAMFHTREARALVVEHAQQLADDGHTVSLWLHTCDHVSSVVFVSTDYNPRKTIDYRHLTAPCDSCTP